VTEQARIALEAVANKCGHRFDFVKAAIGGKAIDTFGVPLPDETLDLCKRADAILLGAVGGPEWDGIPTHLRPEQGLLGLRRGLRLYANIRPVKAPARPFPSSPLKPEIVEGTDMIFVRELTGGIYFGEKKLEPVDDIVGERATDVSTYTTAEITAVVRIAGKLARERSGLVTSVDKANVLETSRLWRRVATHVMNTEFPDVRLEHRLVDSFSMDIILRPSAFDVIVTENMFGDILTDEASVLAGSIGALPSASLGDADVNGRRRGMYEPIHGSAPSIAGYGVANPTGAILSAAMLLRHSLGLEHEATLIERAVAEVINAGILTLDLIEPGGRPCNTTQFGRSVALAIAGY
jgi:3-isopropylmalate dehydrogenase